MFGTSQSKLNLKGGVSYMYCTKMQNEIFGPPQREVWDGDYSILGLCGWAHWYGSYDIHNDDVAIINSIHVLLELKL